MRDHVRRILRYLGAVVRPRAPEVDEPLPPPPGPQEHAANVEFMAQCLFGLSAKQVGVQGLIEEISLDDV